MIKGKNGKLVNDAEDISECWKHYIEELYSNEIRTEDLDYLESEQILKADNKRAIITRKELDLTLNQKRKQ